MEKYFYNFAITLSILFSVGCDSQSTHKSANDNHTPNNEIISKLGFKDSHRAPDYVESYKKYKQFRVEIDGKSINYYVFYPQKNRGASDVLIALHGSGRTGISMLDVWSSLAAEKGFVVMAPNAQNIEGWGHQDSLDTITKAINNDLKIKGWAAKSVYLFGHSSGGLYALSSLGSDATKRFKAIAVHGAAQPNDQIGFLSDGGNSQRVGIFVGDSDALFSISSARKNKEWLLKEGFQPTMYIIKNHTHWYYQNYHSINQFIWNYLSSS